MNSAGYMFESVGNGTECSGWGERSMVIFAKV